MTRFTRLFMQRMIFFYYWLVPFGLVNVINIYHKMVNKLFKVMLERNMQAYVNNMLIKFTKKVGHTTNLRKHSSARRHKTFSSIRLRERLESSRGDS